MLIRNIDKEMTYQLMTYHRIYIHSNNNFEFRFRYGQRDEVVVAYCGASAPIGGSDTMQFIICCRIRLMQLPLFGPQSDDACVDRKGTARLLPAYR